MLRNALKAIRRAIAQALAKVLPWDSKLDRIEAKLARMESLLERTYAHVNLGLADRVFVEEMFVRAHGCLPNLDRPRTFNEKLAWTKLHRHEPIYAELADKSRCKHYVREHLGSQFIIESIVEYDSAHELDFSSLPDRFVLKPSHGSGWTIIVWDKATADLRAIRRTLHQWMSTNYYCFQREPQYRPLVPKLIVERLMLDAGGKPPDDFKFHCFHGKVAYVQVDLDRHTAHRRNFYDRTWQLQPFEFSPSNDEAGPRYPKGKDIRRPDKFAELVQAAEKLAAPFDYVRVDLYLVEHEIFFGEMTFTHEAGAALFYPRKWDEIWGDLWTLKNA